MKKKPKVAGLIRVVKDSPGKTPLRVVKIPPGNTPQGYLTPNTLY
jgi:hypothetical protein